jgi:hypothetical protein
LANIHADQLLLRVAGQERSGAIDVLQTAVEVVGIDNIAGVLDQLELLVDRQARARAAGSAMSVQRR